MLSAGRLFRRRVPILAVHGFEGHGAKDVSELKGLTSLGATALGYYTGDTGFPVVLPGPATTDTSLSELGGRLAEFVTAQGVSVDLVGHSMGGLIIADALQRLPPARVRRVVMLGVPFLGLPSAAGADVAQCREMTPGSAWLAAAAEAGWRADLTVASEADEAVPVDSALGAGVGRTLLLPSGLGVHHGDLVSDPVVLRRIRSALR